MRQKGQQTATDFNSPRTAAEKVGQRTSIGPAIVLHPFLKRSALAETAPLREPQARLEEAKGLALAIGLDIVYAATISLESFRPATLLGSGKVDEIALRVEGLKPVVVIIDAAVTPVQQRNLERAWKTKVLDRTVATVA